MKKELKSIIENEEFRKTLKEDLVLMEDSLETEVLLNQTKKNKYVTMLYRKIRKLASERSELSKTYNTRYNYYMYEYQNDPANNDGIVLDKTEVKQHVLADDDYIIQKQRVETLENDIKYLTDIKSMFEERNWSIKNKIELMIFLQGER